MPNATWNSFTFIDYIKKGIKIKCIITRFSNLDVFLKLLIELFYRITKQIYKINKIINK